VEAVNTRLLVEARAEKAPRRFIEIFRDLSRVNCDFSDVSNVFSFGDAAIQEHTLGSLLPGCSPFSFHVFSFEVVFRRHALGSNFAGDRLDFSYHVFSFGAAALHRHALGSSLWRAAPFSYYSGLHPALHAQIVQSLSRFAPQTLLSLANRQFKIYTHLRMASQHTLGSLSGSHSQIFSIYRGYPSTTPTIRPQLLRCRASLINGNHCNHVFSNGENGNCEHALGSWFCCLSPFFFFQKIRKEVCR
jgi:hypothetical protein